MKTRDRTREQPAKVQDMEDEEGMQEPQPAEEPLPLDPNAQAKEKDRIKELKKSKNSFMKGLAQENPKKKKDRDTQMKELIAQAEKYASFLLSKHKMQGKG